VCVFAGETRNHGVWSQVYESEQEYHDELSRLSDELASCKLEASQHEAVLNSVRMSSDEKISRLQEDKAILQVCISHGELHWLGVPLRVQYKLCNCPSVSAMRSSTVCDGMVLSNL